MISKHMKKNANKQHLGCLANKSKGMIMKLLKLSLSLSVLIGISLISSAGVAATAELAWEKKGFKTPESTLFDSERNVIYVSNINGKPTEKDNNGSIALLSADGKVAEQEWVVGLNAPKGLALIGDTLYVSDLNELVLINVDTQKISKRYTIKNAKFLNDVVADKNGDVYVSDFLDNTIYRLKDDVFEAWLADEALETPNGLLIEDGQLLVGSWGVMTDGFATKVSGHMKSINLETKKIISLGGNTKPAGNLDGIESDGKEGYYATDYLAGSLMHIDKKGVSKQIIDLEQSSADIGIMNGMVLIPMMNQGTVRAYNIKP